MLRYMQYVLLLLLTAVFPSALSAASVLQPMASSSMAWYLAGLELGQWERYLASRLTPDLAMIKPVEIPEISWLRIDQDLILPDFARRLVERRDAERFSLLSRARVTEIHAGRSSGVSTGNQAAGLTRKTVLAGFSHRVSNNRLSVAAVLASQQFSHSMLDLVEYRGDFTPVDFFSANRELSQGAGLQLGLATELAPRLTFNALYQSAVNMDDLASVRGIHGQSANLDIPPRLGMGLDMRLGRDTLFTFAVSQVFYGDVQAFASRALPARFNALLGDSSSPVFEWSDLTVYSMGMRWQHESDLELRLDFHTRSQPRPTEPVLNLALGDALAQNSLMVGLGKGIGERARLDLSASYAPPEFAFGGNVLGIVSDQLDQALEVAARLNIRF